MPARWFRALVLAIVLAAGPTTVLAQDTARAELIFLDMGQGDAILIRSPERKIALIDAGPGSIAQYLSALGVDTIDLAIASHPHADHIGGMEEVIATHPVRYYLDNGAPHTTATYRSLMQRLEQSAVPYLEATARTIVLGGVTLRILPPPLEGERNNRSVGVVVEFGDFKAILTGDSEWAELAYFEELGVPDVAVLKAAHHGSANGVTEAWLAATTPELVVISVGRGNTYGHPHPGALSLYQTAATVYRTDFQGTIAIHASADGTFDVETGAATAGSARSGPAGGLAGRGRPSAVSDAGPTAAGAIGLSVFADAPGNDHQNLNGEYVILTNTTSETLDIAGWTLCDLVWHCYTFPQASSIGPEGSVTVYTGSGSADARHFYMGFGAAVWNNDGDVATLFDRAGQPVARYAY